MDSNRGTGRTTRQMLEAPQGATYVVHHHAEIWHAKQLAIKHKRSDLQIVSRSWITGESWRGQQLKPVVIDHATFLDEREWRMLVEGINPGIRSCV